MPPDRLSLTDLRAVLLRYREVLKAHARELNDLNVFPVPDGDSGTNLLLTVTAATAGIDSVTDLVELRRSVTHNALRGARGNSGVILSQVLAGFMAGLEHVDEIDGRSFITALRTASTRAYAAVPQPLEGTILTVIRAAAEEAEATADDDLAAVVRAARDGASAALEATPHMLPALADAGVVDAGGKGVLLLLQTLVAALDGEPIPAPEEVHKLEAARPRGPRYEVMFLLGASEGAVGDMTQAWSKLGDSIIVGGQEGTYNCHIHTDRVDETLGAAKAAGAVSEIAVTDLYEEVGGRGDTRDCCSLIAIAEGPGTAKLLESLGADAVLQPSQVTGDGLRRAIEGRLTPEVVLLVVGDELDEEARRAGEATSKKVAVRVVPSGAEAVAEIVFFDPAVPADENVASLDEASAGVSSGRVIASNGGYVGLQGHDEVTAGNDVVDVAVVLLDSLIRDHHEVVTVLTGRGLPEGAEERLRVRLEEQHPDIVAELYEGGGKDPLTFCAS